MKMYGTVCIIVAVIMLLAPLAALPSARSDIKSEASVSEKSAEAVTESTADAEDVVSVFMTSEGRAEQLPLRDYIVGVVAAEMPASYEEEALKAQALVAVTFTRYRQASGGDKELENAVISDDSSKHQGYISKEEMQAKWGDAFDVYYERICGAVDCVLHKVITSNGKPIMAAYHAMSSGRTEAAENIWGADVPYLRSVDSHWDKDSTRFFSEVVLSREKIAEIMSVDADEVYIKTKSTTPCGTVLSIDIGGNIITGIEARELFGLRSPVFTVEKDGDNYIFSVSGYGHGVGMSQNGADSMAREGYTYSEIIKHYYQGVEIADA